MILSFLSVAVPISLQPSVCLHFNQHSVIVIDLNVFKIFLFGTLNGSRITSKKDQPCSTIG